LWNRAVIRNRWNWPNVSSGKKLTSEVTSLFIVKRQLGTNLAVGWGDVDWIGLTQDRNRWRALVNSVLNLPVP
jgi:hypothetical protein